MRVFAPDLQQGSKDTSEAEEHGAGVGSQAGGGARLGRLASRGGSARALGTAGGRGRGGGCGGGGGGGGDGGGFCVLEGGLAAVDVDLVLGRGEAGVVRAVVVAAGGGFVSNDGVILMMCFWRGIFTWRWRCRLRRGTRSRLGCMPGPVERVMLVFRMAWVCFFLG